MTEKANPSFQRNADSFKTAGAIALAGGSNSGWVSPAASPSDIAVQDADITHGNLNAFAQTSSSSSFDVTIDPGEAFVYGAWLAIDTSTTVTLASSTAAQTVYVGWNKDGTDDVIVGLASAFASASGDSDEKIPLFDFDTDGSGVTAVTDRREIGYTQDVDGKEYFGSKDFSLSYDSVADTLVARDEVNDVNIIEANKNGNVEIPTGNLRLATGRSIEDGSGNNRLEVNSAATKLNFDNGADSIILESGVKTQINSYTGAPLIIRDTEGSFDAVRYDTANSAPGQLDLTNADLIVGSNNIYFQPASSGGLVEGLTFESNTNSGSDFARIKYHDDYYGDGTGEASALEIEVVNDAPGGAGPDSLVIDTAGYLDARDADGGFVLPTLTSDPSVDSGTMWYRSDLD